MGILGLALSRLDLSVEFWVSSRDMNMRCAAPNYTITIWIKLSAAHRKLIMTVG